MPACRSLQGDQILFTEMCVIEDANDDDLRFEHDHILGVLVGFLYQPYNEILDHLLNLIERIIGNSHSES